MATVAEGVQGDKPVAEDPPTTTAESPPPLPTPAEGRRQSAGTPQKLATEEEEEGDEEEGDEEEEEEESLPPPRVKKRKLRKRKERVPWSELEEDEEEGWESEEEYDEYEGEDEDEDEDEYTDDDDDDEEDEEDVEEEEILSEAELERLRAKAARQRRREERPEPQNVDGGIPVEMLRTLTKEMLVELIAHTRKDIEHLKTENYLYERTIERLEEPEKIVEALFASKNAAEAEEAAANAKNNTATTVCSSEESSSADDDEEEEEGEDGEPDYSPVIPIEEIDPSKDSFFDNMSDNSKEAALNYFRNIGIIAPPKYDVMRHKYGKYVKGAKESESYSRQAGAGVVQPTRLKSSIFKAGTALIEEKNKKTTVDETTLKVITMFSHWMGEEEDEFLVELDYPDFDVSDVKKLRVEDKLKLAQQAEEEFRKKFYHNETQTLKEEGALDVNIDVHQHSVRMLLNLCKDFEMIANDAYHPMTAKNMSDMIIRLRRKMSNAISGEETKTRMAIREILAIRQRYMHQLRCAKRTGFNVSEVDFNYLTAQNEIYHNEMVEMNVFLKYLKQHSNNFFHILDEDQDETKDLVKQEGKFAVIITKRKRMLKNFEKTYKKYRLLILKTNARLAELKRKLQALHAPKPMEYIRLTATQYEMEAEVARLEKRSKDLNLKLVTVRTAFSKLCQTLPGGVDGTELENEAWLASVHAEVEAGDLISDMDPSSDEDDLPPSLQLHPPPNPKKRSYGKRSGFSYVVGGFGEGEGSGSGANKEVIGGKTLDYPLLTKKSKPQQGISNLGVKEKRKILARRTAADVARSSGVDARGRSDERVKRKSRIRIKTAHTILLETPVHAGPEARHDKPEVYDTDLDFQTRMEF